MVFRTGNMLRYWGFLFGFLVIGYYAWTVFSPPPFLQQEVISPAVWWNDPNTSFTEVLFDTQKTDRAPGRFRYAHYLFEAAYWKAFKAGWMPKDLYDYSAFVITCLLGCILFGIARRRRLGVLEALLISAFFVLSVQSFMITVFHHRKAKYLVSILFILIIMLAPKYRIPSRRHILSGISFVGFFTDPVFILLAPLLAISLDIHYRGSKYPITVAVLKGMFLGGISFLLLNGVIGPLFTENCQLLLTEIPDKPTPLLNFANTKIFYRILPDLIAPMKYSGNTLPIVWVLMAAYAGITSFLLLKGFRQCPFLIGFLLILIPAAFLVQPDAVGGRYASYYGHPILLLFVLAWVDVLSFAKSHNWKWLQRGTCAFLLLFIILHQTAKLDVYWRWVQRCVPENETAKKYISDYNLIKYLSKRLKQSPNVPFYVTLDYSNAKVNGPLDSIYDLQKGENQQQHTILAYGMIPILFDREIKSGSLVLRKN